MAEKPKKRRLIQSAFNNNSLTEKPLPHSLEIEKTVIGTLLQFNMESVCQKIMNELQPEYLYRQEHQLLTKAMLHLFRKGKPIDIVTVTEQCRFDGVLDLVGGPFNIAILANGISHAVNLEYHFRILYQYYVRRKIIEYSNTVAGAAFDDTMDMFDLLDRYIDELDSCRIQRTFKDIRKASTIATDFLREISESDFPGNRSLSATGNHKTGHPRFDETVTITRDKIILLAGGAKHGKSKLVAHFMFNLLEQNKDIAVFWVSLEDSQMDILRSYLASKILIKPKWIREKRFSEKMVPQLRKWSEVFKAFDIEFRDQVISSAEIVSHFAQFCLERQEKFPILVVDNVMSLKDREKYQHDLNGMYDYVMHNMLICRQRTHGLIWVLHHFNDAQQNKDNINDGYRPKLTDIKGTEAFRRVPNQVLMINNPSKHKDLMTQYQGDRQELLKYLFIIDAGANREDDSSDDVALLHYFCSLDFNLFKEIEIPKRISTSK